MNISIEKFIGFGKNFNDEIIAKDNKQRLNNYIQDHLIDPKSEIHHLEGRNVRYLTSFIDGAKR
jgi:hypothetical protein